MKFATILCLTLSISGCSANTPRSPIPPTPQVVPTPQPVPSPTPYPAAGVVLWGIVVDPSGTCIEGATVEVVRGPMLLGQKVTQNIPSLPCDVARFTAGTIWTTGGFHFDDPVSFEAWEEMTLRVSAPGYISRDQNLSEVGWLTLPTFTLFPVGL
jgi:hypothetical protein